MSMPAQPQASSASQQQPRKMTALERNRLEWETHKNEIEEVYMDQDKTLEEAMSFFKEKRGLDWSKRYWKIKLKEWKFEKNVPAKEMSFMAAKARKRELDCGKETVFYRNGVLVDASKVENKKQKLNVDDADKLMVPETPQYMSYETPKHSFSQENDASSPNLEPQNSELEEVSGELGLEYRLRNEDQPVTSTNRENPDRAASPTTRIHDQIKVIDLTGDSQNSSSEHIAQMRICPEEEMASAVEPMPKSKLGEYFSSARQLRREGQVCRAAQHYFKAIRNCLDGRSAPRTPMIVVLGTELLQCVEDVEPSDVPTLACNCVDLLHKLHLMYSCTSQAYHSVLSALERLLVAHPEIPQGINLHPVLLALDNQGTNAAPLHKALYSLLALMRNQLLTKDARNEFQFRICLLAFACDLRASHKSRFLYIDREVSSLKAIIWKLWTLGKLLGSELNTVSSWDTMISGIYCAYGDREQWLTGCYSSAEPSITELADTCSLNGWRHEAEMLFEILRSSQSSIIVSKFRMVQISITYCLHLEREKRYEKLLDGLLVLYKELEYAAGKGWAFIYFQEHASEESKDIYQVAIDVRNILDRVPDRYQYISSEKAREITRLSCFFEAAGREKLGSEKEVNGSHIVAQADRVEAEDNDDQMEDCMSSVRFGVTYTDSGITGVSFNYSDLYK